MTHHDPFFRRREKGVIIAITLIGLLLLAAVVLFVVNIGQQVDHRVATQNAADSAAQAAAGWAGRSLNTVAANNTNMARTVAVINVLDSFPQAADYTQRETETLQQSLELQISRGVGGSPAELAQAVLNFLTQLDVGMEENLQQLEPVTDLFNQYDVSELTFYSSNGYLWDALYASDEMNRALMDEYAAMIQLAGVRGGDVNLGGSSGVVILPLQPEIPHERGQFNDLERPVRYGLLPTDVDDDEVSRGPWDTVFGWRDVLSETTGGTQSGGTRNSAGGGRPNNPVSRGEGSNGTNVGGTTTPIGYQNYGPHTWLLRRMGDFTRENLEYTRLNQYLRRIADIKLEYLWPTGRQRRRVFEPEWRIDFTEAIGIAAAGMPQINETAFFVVEIKSKFPPSHGSFMEPGTWGLAFNSQGDWRPNPRVAVVGGWQDPRSWGLPMVSPYVWRDEWQTQVYWDADIGITPVITGTDANGNPTYQPQTVYRIDHIAWGGINVGPEAQVRNPYAGFNPNADDSPAPMNLVRSQLEPDDEVARRRYLSFLAVARRADDPVAWPGRFRGGRPYPNMVGLAQSRIFNDHSWDLWTQMWHSRIEPVDDLDGWVDAFSAGVPPSNVSATDLQDLQRYLSNLRQLAASTLVH